MRNRVISVLLALLLVLTLTACGGSSMAKMEEAAVAEPAAASTSADYGGGVQYDTAAELADGQTRKLICTAELQMETTAFDEATVALAELTEQYSGYFENSTVGERSKGYRWAEYTIRVPAKGYQRFLNQAGELCHETWRNTSQEDVTENYYDTQGRLKTQQIKLERLQMLLSRAEKMEDIITIENAISETEWTIEELSGTLRHYDALVDYATVHISLNEVYKLSNVEEVPDSFATRLSTAFSDGWSSFAESMEEFIVALAYSWMWLVVLTVVIVVVVCVLRRKKFKLPLRRKKDDKGAE